MTLSTSSGSLGLYRLQRQVFKILLVGRHIHQHHLGKFASSAWIILYRNAGRILIPRIETDDMAYTCRRDQRPAMLIFIVSDRQEQIPLQGLCFRQSENFLWHCLFLSRSYMSQKGLKALYRVTVNRSMPQCLLDSYESFDCSRCAGTPGILKLRSM